MNQIKKDDLLLSKVFNEFNLSSVISLEKLIIHHLIFLSQFSTYDTLNNRLLARRKFHVFHHGIHHSRSPSLGCRWPAKDDQFLKQMVRSSQFASRGRAKKWDTRASRPISWNIHSSGYFESPLASPRGSRIVFPCIRDTCVQRSEQTTRDRNASMSQAI